MEIIDAQIHVWEHEPAPGRPWDDIGGENDAAVEIEDAIASLDAIGADGAVLNLPPHYRTRHQDADGNDYFVFDNSYAEEAALRYPGRIASAARQDHGDPELEDRIRETMRGAGTVCIRVPVQRAASIELVKQGRFDRLFKACEDQEVPVMILAQPYLDVVADLLKRFPDLVWILDHLALTQPSKTMKVGPEPFADVDKVVAFSKHPNVSVKFSGAPSLSQEPYPFADLWPQMHRYVEAFGPERLMWGSDYTRCRGMHTHEESLRFVRDTDELGESDKEQMLGKTLRRWLRWDSN